MIFADFSVTSQAMEFYKHYCGSGNILNFSWISPGGQIREFKNPVKILRREIDQIYSIFLSRHDYPENVIKKRCLI